MRKDHVCAVTAGEEQTLYTTVPQTLGRKYLYPTVSIPPNSPCQKSRLFPEYYKILLMISSIKSLNIKSTFSKGDISIKIRPFLLEQHYELINTLKSLENL